MIVRAWERARAAGADEVVVATDDERVRDAVIDAGGEAWMTRTDHPSGTDRLAEVAMAAGWSHDTIVVNLQGDEPLLPPDLPAQLAAALTTHPDAGIATMAVRITEAAELVSPNAVKVVLDEEGYALYFSRAPIPWVRDAFTNGVPASLPPDTAFLRHLGLYAYRAGTLTALANTPTGVLERAESLEQLRAMAVGVRIHVSLLPEAPPPGIDTEADLLRAREYFHEAHE